MLGFRLDAVKSNAAAYLQHLCYRNDKVKTDVRKLKGIPVLVGLLDHPKRKCTLVPVELSRISLLDVTRITR